MKATEEIQRETLLQKLQVVDIANGDCCMFFVSWFEFSLMFIKIRERHQRMLEDGSLGKSVVESDFMRAHTELPSF